MVIALPLNRVHDVSVVDVSPDSIDAATLPKFTNENRCARCDRFWGLRIRYCPSCSRIRGQHFHRFCPCGATWEER